MSTEKILGIMMLLVIVGGLMTGLSAWRKGKS